MRVNSFLFLSLLLIPMASQTAQVPVPEGIERQSVAAWINSIGAVNSPFQDYVFDWHEEQANLPLPPEVEKDPDNIFVSVDRPLQETIDLEGMGEIEAGITYGLETYTKINADVQTVLATLLFRWGRPIGKEEGITYPVDSVFSQRTESIWQQWGYRSYLNRSIKTNGGFAKDIRDDLFLLVRGDAERGYDLVGGFVRPAGNTSTKTYFMITQIRPLANGYSAYKVSGRQMGQSYKALGLEFGRRNFGFNVSRIHGGQKEFVQDVLYLKEHGRIPERLPQNFYEAMGMAILSP